MGVACWTNLSGLFERPRPLCLVFRQKPLIWVTAWMPPYLWSWWFISAFLGYYGFFDPTLKVICFCSCYFCVVPVHDVVVCFFFDISGCFVALLLLLILWVSVVSFSHISLHSRWNLRCFLCHILIQLFQVAKDVAHTYPKLSRSTD